MYAAEAAALQEKHNIALQAAADGGDAEEDVVLGKKVKKKKGAAAMRVDVEDDGMHDMGTPGNKRMRPASGGGGVPRLLPWPEHSRHTGARVAAAPGSIVCAAAALVRGVGTVLQLGVHRSRHPSAPMYCVLMSRHVCQTDECMSHQETQSAAVPLPM